MPQIQTPPKFALGRIFITASAARQLSGQDVAIALRRHLCGDWGDLTFSDRQQNERALRHQCRLFSAYRSARGQRFYVITEPLKPATDSATARGLLTRAFLRSIRDLPSCGQHSAGF
jgi:hypothetical protein